MLLKLIFVVAFLFFSPHVAGAGNDCPDAGKDLYAWWQCMEKAHNAALQANPDSCGPGMGLGKTLTEKALKARNLRVLGFQRELREEGIVYDTTSETVSPSDPDYEGGYISPEKWNILPLGDKQAVATVLAIYRDCLMAFPKREKWSMNIKIYDVYTGKEMGRLSPAGYKDK